MVNYLKVILMVILGGLSLQARYEKGDDLVKVFHEAQQGKPLRTVTIGGSITQAGKGWIGPWLTETFPNTVVNHHNAGMSATGSSLGVFRLQRDVISLQPDLVLIEFAVNDGGTDDETVYWALESIIKSLSRQPKKPAIVFVETASKDKSKVYRHNRIADHYSFVNINLQTEIDNYIKENNLQWKDLFGDAVHPNKAGHKVYTEIITSYLQPYVEKAKTDKGGNRLKRLPKPISKDKLMTDGRMIPIPEAEGWNSENSLPFWWNKFFNGVKSAKEPGTTLKLTFRGTVAGLLYPLNKDKYGKFFANIDGNGYREYSCNYRGGYTYTIINRKLAPCEHIMNIALPLNYDHKQGVKMGYLLVGGSEKCSAKLAKQGYYTVDKLKNISYQDIPAGQWEWCGPYGDISKPAMGNDDLKTAFAPEKKPDSVKWQKITLDEIDFGKLTGYEDRGVNYARTTINCEEKCELQFALRVDYWAKVWINDEPVYSIMEGHGRSVNALIFSAGLKKGANKILIKTHSGSKGNKVSLEIIK